MRRAALVADLVVTGCFAMAIGQMLPAPSPSSTARDLGIYQQRPAEGLEEQGRQALANDARRRELRFQEAVKPGLSFASTRVGESELSGRSPQEIFALGAQLFHHRVRRREGFGARDLPSLGRVHRAARGGPDAYSCGACHHRGGIAGAGPVAANAYYDGDGNRPASALQRNAPSLAGAGLVELLAREITKDLQSQQAQAKAQAKQNAAPVAVALQSKGVSFGELRASPNGRVDYSKVTGVDRDLVVRPFGWKGHAASLRELIEDQLLLHLGMQTDHLVATAPASKKGPFDSNDPDGDGVTSEVSEGQLSALTLFLALNDAPTSVMPKESFRVALWARGRKQFDTLGCADCHRPWMRLNSSIYELKSRTGQATIRIDLAQQGLGQWLEKVPGEPGYRVYLYSDLKRHVMGPNLREQRAFRGINGASFRTPALWGVARSRPYLHDGRAQTLDLAIEAHSGEALAAQRAYKKLNDKQRAPLRTFLTSLSRSLRLVAH